MRRSSPTLGSIVVRAFSNQIGKLAAVVALWLLVAGLCVVMVWPQVPKTWGHWVLFVLVAPPLYLAAEAAGGWLFSQKHGHAISSRAFSVLRIAAALVAVLAAVAVSWWLSTMGAV